MRTGRWAVRRTCLPWRPVTHSSATLRARREAVQGRFRGGRSIVSSGGIARLSAANPNCAAAASLTSRKAAVLVLNRDAGRKHLKTCPQNAQFAFSGEFAFAVAIGGLSDEVWCGFAWPPRLSKSLVVLVKWSRKRDREAVALWMRRAAIVINRMSTRSRRLRKADPQPRLARKLSSGYAALHRAMNAGLQEGDLGLAVERLERRFQKFGAKAGFADRFDRRAFGLVPGDIEAIVRSPTTTPATARARRKTRRIFRHWWQAREISMQGSPPAWRAETADRRSG